MGVGDNGPKADEKRVKFVFCLNRLLSGVSHYTSDRLKKTYGLFHLGINTSSPTPPMYESRKINAGFVSTYNPDNT